MTDESLRGDAERRYVLLEADPDEPYRSIAGLSSRICGVPMAGIAVVSQDRGMVKGPVGLPNDTEFVADFARHTLSRAVDRPVRPLMIENATLSPEFKTHPWVTGAASVRFYAGTPIVIPGDIAAGVLFVAGCEPRTLSTDAENSLLDLARQTALLFDNRIRIALLELTIARQRKDEEDLKTQVEQIHAYSRELQVHAVRLEAINARLEALAKLDGMTGLKNHRAFQERLEFEFQRAMRYSMPLSLLLLDVDNFKQFNDTFGHLAGDEVLKTVAQVLQDNARGVDFVARYGGEEFVVILPHADEAASVAIGERLRAAIENVVWPLRSVTASFGISTLTHSMTHASDLIALADKALYGSKTAGRNCVTHSADMGNDAK